MGSFFGKSAPGGLRGPPGRQVAAQAALRPPLGGSWGALGGSWAGLGTLLAPLGAVLGLPGRSPEAPGEAPGRHFGSFFGGLSREPEISIC